MNSADNGNGWAEIRTQGSIGLIPGGRVNRDGIGAVLMFTPDGGKEVMRPIVAGSSFESQDSLVADFGLGQAKKGTVDIVWPGGVRNRLYDVHDHERLVFPEIPFSYDANIPFDAYLAGVQQSLAGLVRSRLSSSRTSRRCLSSAVRSTWKPTVYLSNRHRSWTSVPDPHPWPVGC